MTTAQKVIKYLALAFAVFLIVSIFSAILSITYEGLYAVGAIKDNSIMSEAQVITNDNDILTSIIVDSKSSDVVIKTGDKFSVETNNKNVSYENENGKVLVKERKITKLFWRDKNEGTITVTIPSNITLDSFVLNSGFGLITVDGIVANHTDFSLGAGSVKISNIKSLVETKINGGAGEVLIDNSILTNVDFDLGVGRTTINAYMYGSSKIDAGIGEVNINLLDSVDKYRVKVDKGIGSVKYNGENVGNTTIGTGINYIDIDGGIGSINITTK